MVLELSFNPGDKVMFNRSLALLGGLEDQVVSHALRL